jgi:dCTP deaminase
MSFLTGKSIKQLLSENVNETDRITIIGLNDIESQIGPCSIDLRLSDEITRFKPSRFYTIFDSKQSKNPQIYNSPTHENEGFVIAPGELILAKSIEIVKLPKNRFGLITGRSSFSRLGIEIQLTQDLLQPGRFGVIPFQLKNNSPLPIRLYPGIRIAQLLVGQLDQDCEKGYDESPNAKYKNETGVKTYQYKGDPESEKQYDILENKIPSKSYLKNFLNLLLIMALFLVVENLFQGQGFDKKTIITSGVLILTLIVRIIMFVKGE